jgi:hypothetical protein
MTDVLMAGVVFFAIYHILKSFTDFLLKRKIVKSGHFEKAEILEQKTTGAEEGEVNKYPSLKWGLVAFMGGLGLIVIEILKNSEAINIDYSYGVLPVGIELVFISLAFLIYFVIVTFISKRK